MQDGSEQAVGHGDAVGGRRQFSAAGFPAEDAKAEFKGAVRGIAALVEPALISERHDYGRGADGRRQCGQDQSREEVLD